MAIENTDQIVLFSSEVDLTERESEQSNSKTNPSTVDELGSFIRSGAPASSYQAITSSVNTAIGAVVESDGNWAMYETETDYTVSFDEVIIRATADQSSIIFSIGTIPLGLPYLTRRVVGGIALTGRPAKSDNIAAYTFALESGGLIMVAIIIDTLVTGNVNYSGTIVIKK